MLKKLWDFLTLKKWKLKRARKRYDVLKALILDRHFAGYAGLTLIPKLGKFSKKDMACFRTPMYSPWVKDKLGNWCVFWERGLMTREVGSGAPLRTGEVLIPDPSGKIKPSSTLETIDEQKPLTNFVKGEDVVGRMIDPLS